MTDRDIKAEWKLAVVISHPIQYWVPVYRALAELSNIDIKVFYVAENGAYEYYDTEFAQTIKWDIPLTEGYDYEFLSPGRVLDSFGFFSVDADNVVMRLRAFAPDAILINGYAQRVNWRVLSAFSNQASIIYTSDSNLDAERSWWKTKLKSIVLGYFFSKVDVCLSTSPKNRQYLELYGVASQSIVDSLLPVDTQRWYQQRGQISDQDIEHLHAELGIRQGDRVLLFAGKLADHKRPQDVIEAVGRLRQDGLPVCAIIVGSGAMLNELKALAVKLAVTEAIKLVGFINQSQLGKYFAASDILVFPSSREAFGLVASEVLAFGLPIVAADNIGAVGASILPGENGLVYPCGAIGSLAEQIELLIGDPNLYQRYSEASAAMAEQFDKHMLVDIIFNLVSSNQNLHQKRKRKKVKKWS